eukprot:9505736-Alexandrium_andersonii.AAC.1
MGKRAKRRRESTRKQEQARESATKHQEPPRRTKNRQQTHIPPRAAIGKGTLASHRVGRDDT